MSGDTVADPLQTFADLRRVNAELEQRLDRALAERDEALAQQTATAEVLGVINTHPGDLAPVFDAILEKATLLCEATIGTLWTFDSDGMRAAAILGAPPEYAEFLTRGPLPPTAVQQRLLHGEQAIQIADLAATDLYRSGNPLARAAVDLGGVRTLLAVALRKDDAAIGFFAIYRQEVRPFTEKQIALLQNFAAQAVIAIENARLLDEIREALEQQTATAEVLQVINSSPGDLAPVFEAMLEKAMHLCGAAFGQLHTYDGEGFPTAALRGLPAAYAEYQAKNPPTYGPGTAPWRIVQGEHVVHLVDLANSEAYRAGDAARRATVDLGGCHTLLTVALRREHTLLGTVSLYRQEVRPFSEKQIALLQNFAAQAVIAIENARLLTETHDALERYSLVTQAAGEGVYEWDTGRDEVFASSRLLEIFGLPDSGFSTADWRQRVHPEDLPAYRSAMRDCLKGAVGRLHCEYRARHDSGEYLWIEDSALPVRDDAGRAVRLIGAVSDITDRKRSEVEIREALERQTATAEVLQVINSSPGDLAPVFEAMLERAMRLCEAAFGIMFIAEGDLLRIVAERDVPKVLSDYMAREPPQAGPDTFLSQAIRARKILHAPDAREAEPYRKGIPLAVNTVELGGVRALLMAPLLKDEAVLGVFAIFRHEARPFTEKQIALLQNFAAQAVIAMENARLISETREALEQQTATAEVLQVINSSPGNLAPVFDMILEKAHTLCGVEYGSLQIATGDFARAVAVHGLPPEFAQRLRQGYGISSNPSVQALLDGAPFSHIHDLTATVEHPVATAAIEIGMRTFLAVALRHENKLHGFIVAARSEVKPFSDREISLLQNFAQQAVIAMENARLITETREALDQQTATAEVLGVINSSPGDLAPVFDAMLEKATRLCEARTGHLLRYADGNFSRVASLGVPEDFDKLLPLNQPLPHVITRDSVPYRTLVTRSPINIADLREDASYQACAPAETAAANEGGVRSVLFVPLLKDSEVVGNFVMHRLDVRPFSGKQIVLLQNFAAQAVIAMENARLITETREALEQQTATAEVLGVINSSPGDLTPVFQAMLEKATRLCEAAFGIANTYDGEGFRTAALHEVPSPLAELWLSAPPVPGPNSPLARIARGEDVVHIEDFAASPGYEAGEPRPRAMVELGGAHSYIAVALRKDGKLLGTIAAFRQEVRPFTDKQIALLQNFAAQAVIAMENARLIAETREALDQQTATAEVLGVINSSPGDLAPVFEAILEKAHSLCAITYGSLQLYDGEKFRAVAVHNLSEALADQLRQGYSSNPNLPNWRLLEGERFAQVPDMAEVDDPIARRVVESGIRTLLYVALRKDDVLLGQIVAGRKEVRPFSDKEIALLLNFAAQAVIAMENARLITETRDARDDAEGALRDLKAAQANLIQAEKMASLGQLTAGIAHEIKNPLNFVNNFASLSVELLDELKETTAPAVAALGEDKRAEVDETIVMLTGNLKKITEHGRRADGIVRSMLEHSRGSSGERRSVDLNRLIEEALNLAYHGARAQDENFNMTLERDFADTIAPIEIVPQDVTRVFLNLFGNGFYAATKRQQEGGDEKFSPTLEVATRDVGDAIEVRVRDNGTGIQAEIKDKLFQPFFTTKPTGEGTGLGLSISYDIVTQQHGGTITVDSRVGEFTEFTVRLPRAHRASAEAAS